MSQPLPVFLEPLRFAETRRALAGELSLERMERLAEFLYDQEGGVVLSLSFDRDRQGVAHAQMRLEARLRLVCQRCLGPWETHIQRSVQLAFTREPGEAEYLADLGYEPVVLERNELLLQGLVEDELLLALPMIPRHEARDCQPRMSWGEADADSADAKQDNPFAVLAQLKRRGESD